MYIWIWINHKLNIMGNKTSNIVKIQAGSVFWFFQDDYDACTIGRGQTEAGAVNDNVEIIMRGGLITVTQLSGNYVAMYS